MAFILICQCIISTKQNLLYILSHLNVTRCLWWRFRLFLSSSSAVYKDASSQLVGSRMIFSLLWYLCHTGSFVREDILQTFILHRSHTLLWSQSLTLSRSSQQKGVNCVAWPWDRGHCCQRYEESKCPDSKSCVGFTYFSRNMKGWVLKNINYGLLTFYPAKKGIKGYIFYLPIFFSFGLQLNTIVWRAFIGVCSQQLYFMWYSFFLFLELPSHFS